MGDVELSLCSGPPGYLIRVLTEAQTYGRTLLFASWALAAFTIIVAWFRPPALWRSAVMLAMALVHPAVWISAMGGDCGGRLRTWSMTWTIAVAIAAVIVLSVPLWRKPTGLPTTG